MNPPLPVAWRSLSRVVVTALPLVVGLTTVGATVALDEVVKLPEFVVAGERPLPPREDWKYVRLENFEVLSSTSDRVTKEFVNDLREFQIVLNTIAPYMLIRAEQPVMVVLCGKDGQFDKLVSKATMSSNSGRGTCLVRDKEIAAIVVDYRPIEVVETVGFLPRFGFFEGRREVHTTREFIRQYIHLAVGQMTPRLPAWAAEGMANIFCDIDYNNKWIEVGKPQSFRDEYVIDSWGMGSQGGAADNLRHMGLHTSGDYDSGRRWLDAAMSSTLSTGGLRTYHLPLVLDSFEKMFAVDYDSPVFRGAAAGAGAHYRSQWRKQVTAFMHMCMYGRKGKYTKAIVEFINRATKEGVSEQLFVGCFGQTYKQMAVELRNYTEFTDYRGMVYRPARKGGSFLSPKPRIEVRPATDGEIGRIKGETLRLSGQDEAARMEFVYAYLRGDREPQLLGSLGLMARQRNDEARAKVYLEAVATAPALIPRPRAYIELARVRMARHLAENKGAPLNQQQLVSVLTPLFDAHRLSQQLADNYVEIATAWLNTSVVPQPGHIAVLEKGMDLFPRHGLLAVETARVQIKFGYRDEAEAIIQRTMSGTSDPKLKAMLNELASR